MDYSGLVVVESAQAIFNETKVEQPTENDGIAGIYGQEYFLE